MTKTGFGSRTGFLPTHYITNLEIVPVESGGTCASHKP